MSMLPLGKKPASTMNKKAIMFDDVFDAAMMPVPPPTFGRQNDIAHWYSYGNDEFGDCHDSKTEVLTNNGWVSWPDYNGRDLLATINPADHALEFQAPLSVKRREHDGPMFFSEHRHMSFAVTPNHRMYHRPYIIPKPYYPGAGHYAEYWRFNQVKDLGRRSLLPFTSGFIGVDLKQLKIGERIWNGDDLITLLALVLSDGFVTGGEHNRGRISFCCFDPKDSDHVRAFSQRLYINETPSRPGVYYFTDYALADWLRVNGYVSDELKSPFKRVPDIIKWASQRQIEIFLTWYGDQYQHPKGRIFVTTSQQMANDLQELMLRLGHRTAIRSRPPRTHGKFIGKYPEFSLFEYSNSEITLQAGNGAPALQDDHYRGEVFCATVPNSTLITRRNGTILISGNCVWAAKAHMHMLWPLLGGYKRNYFWTSNVLSDYSAATGFHADDPNSDQGTDMKMAAEYHRKIGVRDAHGDRHRVQAYVNMTPGNTHQLATASYVFGAVELGILMSEENMKQFERKEPWTITNDDPIGGHCIPLVGRDIDGNFLCVSWGRIQRIAPSFIEKNMDEGITYLDHQILNNAGLSPGAYDNVTLLRMLTKVSPQPVIKTAEQIAAEEAAQSTQFAMMSATTSAGPTDEQFEIAFKVLRDLLDKSGYGWALSDDKLRPYSDQVVISVVGAEPQT